MLAALAPLWIVLALATPGVLIFLLALVVAKRVDRATAKRLD